MITDPKLIKQTPIAEAESGSNVERPTEFACRPSWPRSPGRRGCLMFIAADHLPATRSEAACAG
jgi:hypothetical protein